jgi:hypothetical protein
VKFHAENRTRPVYSVGKEAGYLVASARFNSSMEECFLHLFTLTRTIGWSGSRFFREVSLCHLLKSSSLKIHVSDEILYIFYGFKYVSDK